MQIIAKHTPTAASLLLLVVFLASSGFTMVLYNCTMCEEPAPGCCHDVACSIPVPADAHARQRECAALVSYEEACMSVTVAGGILLDQTVLEKHSVGGPKIKAEFLSENGPQRAVSMSASTASLKTLAFQDYSPRSVEKYALLSTLRI